MSMATQRQQFACPVAWCTGDTLEHGGDGADPGDWLHQGDAVRLGAGLWAQRWQSGTRSDQWELSAGAQSGVLGASTPDALAALLEDAARMLRQQSAAH